ncbi:MAG: 16S rRNA (cytidine(1402)-2'-O)-methyltransferase [Alicyclobacillus herbarius]|uniref:16S rRNA (cytidine(1402)-2'-O)-methyltransferase n=1 Tax=Alicyclobacillus herbarius TaxID=122960 RepID=UPI0023569538|nr:16S rRNA (cytidine(1402)-2'-O)-methyltransferase [Alicyclobacillus herbarius]MCL6633054.1 16S rRNA (cytidine(1402)-2'-O)-methyltransferase [Alicyclobacillus herbarius]
MISVQDSFVSEAPCLWVCSTPIGNLQDVTFRLLDVLRQADVICAEDTRQTRKLLARYEIPGKTLVSYHQHNQASRRDDLRGWWAEGKRIALVSDAGTPLLSDPGEDAVALAVEQGIPVIPVPGPSALLAALAASGCPMLPFTFIGFLPRSNRELNAVLEDVATLPGSVVCYEAPHRLEGTLQRLAERFPGRRVVLGRELTKRHEQFIRGPVEDVLKFVQTEGTRGEYVIVLDAIRRLGERAAGAAGHGREVPAAKDDHAGAVRGEGVSAASQSESAASRFESAMVEVQARMVAGETHTQAVREAARAHGVPRRRLYQATLPETKA